MPFALSWQNWVTFSIEEYVDLHNWFWKSQCTCHQNVTQSAISRSISRGSLYRRSLAFASLYFFRSPFTWRDLHTVGWVMRQTEYKIKTLTIKNELIFMPVQACGVCILHSEKTKHTISKMRLALQPGEREFSIILFFRVRNSGVRHFIKLNNWTYHVRVIISTSRRSLVYSYQALE